MAGPDGGKVAFLTLGIMGEASARGLVEKDVQ